MKIRQKRLSDYAAEGDSSVFGTVEFLIEDEDDLYAVYRLICRNDICKIENNRQFNYDIHAEHCTFDTFLLIIKGKVSTGDKNTRPGSYRTLSVVKNTLLSVNKKTWDFFDTLFLESARLTERTPVRPIVIVSLRKEGGEIHLIGDGWTHEVISIKDEDEMKVFDRLLLRFNSKIDVAWVAYVFIAGDGDIQLKLLQDNKLKFSTLQVPIVADSRENIKNILLHPTVKRKTAQEFRKPLFEVESLQRYQSKTTEQPDFVSDVQAQIILMKDNVKELLVDDEHFRNGKRSLYLELVRNMKQRGLDVTFFSKFNPWLGELGNDGVAAIFGREEEPF